MPGIVDKSHVLNICVDDFVIRKRFSYGTIMVDLDTHRIIDLLPSRETQAVQEWLKIYTGSPASLRMFMQKERKHAQTQHATGFQTVDFVQRKSLCQIIYKKPEDIPVFSQEQYEEVIKKYPDLGQLYAALKEFHEIMFSKRLEKLGQWLDNMGKMDIPGIKNR